MNKRGILTAGIVILLSLLAVSCTFESVENGSGSFAYDLRGLWVSTEETEYSGTLKIAYDTIIITGYDSKQTPPQGDDDKRPFKGYFVSGIEYEGYSEDKKIFIKRNDRQEGISYDYYPLTGEPKFLYFPAWGETLQKRFFASELRGTWESDNPSVYKGTIKITGNTITITGYTSGPSYPYLRPFDGYFREGTIHAGYSDSNTHKIFIEKDLEWQPGISCFYNTESKLLEFDLYGRVEKFRRKSY